VIWWRVYPLGFVDAFPQPPTGPVGPEEHRLRRLVPWLDHVVRLGASGLALGPVFDSATHGYDTLDHDRIDPRLGTDEDFDHLVAEAHRRGLRVQLDGVFNHVAATHPRAVTARRDGPGSVAAEWFRAREVDGRTVLDTFEGHEGLVALNHDHPEVRDAVTGVLRRWLDRGADAWRLDAAYAVPTDFWSDVLGRVRSSHPQAYFEAEVIHGDYVRFVSDSGVDTVTQYELWKAIWSSLNDRNLYELRWSLTRHDQMLATFAPATFIGNHDVTRIASQLDDRRHLPHAVVLLALLGGTPTVYAGDEFGLTGRKEDRAGGDDAVRPPFPDDPAELSGDEEILRLHQRVLGLRRRHPWLHRAGATTDRLEKEYCCLRLSDGEHALRLHLNLSDQPRELPPDGDVLDADPATASSAGLVAAHGWAVTD